MRFRVNGVLLFPILLTLVGLTAEPADATLTLRAEANPNPAEPGELVEVQISVSSTATTGNLTLRIPWPAGLQSFPIVTAGGGCSGSCSVGELLDWDLAPLGPGETVSVAFNEAVASGTDGSTITIPIALLDGGANVANLSLAIEVQADSPLEIAVDPLADPVVSGSLLAYEIVYGNNGADAAADAELSFPIPAGSQFHSATGGGVHVGGTVTWDLGSLGPNSGARERVTVQVDPLAGGTLLLVDAAALSGTVSFQSRESRATALSRVDSGTLLLAAEINPDPAGAKELLETQITLTNTGAGLTGSLTLQMWWPGEELQGFPIVTGGGGCSGSCSVGEYMFWDLGVLGPGITQTVSFNEAVGSISSGTLIPLEIELFEGGRQARNVSHTVLVQSDSPLELTLDPLSDPVDSGSRLVYEIVYGNNGSAAASSTVMSLPLPAGGQFVSATGDGVHSGGTVTWNLGNLPPNTGGRERLIVQIGALADGTLLEIDAATLSGTVNFLPRVTRARAVSRVGTDVIELAAEIDPDPVNANEMLEAQISVANPGVAVTGNLALQIWWPGEELQGFPIVTGGGGCSGSCSVGEYMFWNLGALGPGASQVVSFNEAALNVPDGTLVPFEIELFEGGQPVRTVSHTVLVQSDSPLELAVEPLPDPVAPGGSQVYEIVYGNRGSAAATAELTFPIPAGTELQSASGGGVLVGDTVIWNLGTLPADSGGRQQVNVAAGALPNATLLEVNAATLAGEINFQARESRARAVSRVDSVSLQLSADISPNPIQFGENLDAQIHISNPAAGVTGNLILQARWSGEELQGFPVVVGGGCSGSCSVGEYVVWDLGPLGPGASFDVSFNEDVLNVGTGTLIPIEIELFEGGLPARTHSETVLFHPFADFDGDGEADILDFDDDNDGMPDWWEELHGLNPFDPADANQDPDGDGLTNLEEFLAGTDPNVSEGIIFVDGFESGDTSAW